MKNLKKLANNQFYYNDGDKIVFQSYETIVCEITNFQNGNKPEIKITDGQPQSKTTAKYLNQFLKMMIGMDNYQQIKVIK